MESQEQQPPLCKGGCGFFGNPSNEDLCSLCWKKRCQAEGKAASPPAASAGATATASPVGAARPVSTSGGDEATSTEPAAEASTGAPVEEAPPAKPVQKKKHRCWKCNKKVGLTGFTCRCEYVFCGHCRHADMHDCTFDYKSHDRGIIEKANPVVKGEKVNTF